MSKGYMLESKGAREDLLGCHVTLTHEHPMGAKLEHLCEHT